MIFRAVARRPATDWHDGQNFASRGPQISGFLRPSRSDKRGGRASSRTRDGMWWTRQRRRALAVAGRVEPRERSTGAQDERRLARRSLLTRRSPPSDEGGWRRRVVAYGKTVWS